MKLVYRDTISRRSLLTAFILLAFAAAIFPAGGRGSLTRAAAVASADSYEALSAKDRIEVFEEVWETINEKYYDATFNGIDWRSVRERYRPLVGSVRSDDEFYSLMKRMVGELRDAHTRFHTPQERVEREKLQVTTPGIEIAEVEGQPVITSVEPHSEAARQGVVAGMIVSAIDGKPFPDRLAEARARVGGSSSDRAVRLRLYRAIVDGPPGTTLALRLIRADGGAFNVTLTRRIVADTPVVTTRRLDSGYAYIRLNLWKSPVHKQFKNALEASRDARGLIVDLRGNPGGDVDEVVKIASYFFKGRTHFGRFNPRTGKSIELYTHRDEQVYGGPVALLVNEGSGSGSELFSGVMQETGRAVVIGRQSCGCVLGITKFRKVEGGGELAVSELGYISPKGRRFEGSGVIPDRVTALTIADLQRNRDPALEEAESLLKENGRKGEKAKGAKGEKGKA